MIIDNITLAKVDKADPRYPDSADIAKMFSRPLLDVYEMAFVLDGKPYQIINYVTDPMGIHRANTPEWAAAMLRQMAQAIERHAEHKAAA